MKLGPVKEAQDLMCAREVARIMGVDVHTVTDYWVRKLRLKHIKIEGKKRTLWILISTDDLLDFLKDHQEIWTASKVVRFGLGQEPEWLKEKEERSISNVIVVETQLEAFREYMIENERSENTIDNYMSSIKIFFKKYGEVTKKNMIDFKQWQLSSWKPATADNRAIAMNQFCKFIGKPECCVKKIKIQKDVSLENVITLEQYHKMLDGLKNDGNERGYWMIKYLAKTGARISEFVQLPKSALDKGYFELWTKGKIRRIYIPKPLVEESREYFESQKGELLFPNRYGNQISKGGVAQRIIRWADKYGIPREVAYPHSFRHLYAIEFLKHNQNIALLSNLMGHSSVNTTSIYLQLSKEEQMKQFNEASNW